MGKQVFELSNHLGNVLATITDKKLQVSTNTTSTAYFEADIQTVQDYYAFGMQMPGRKLSGGYRFGFNGKENDNEVKGEGNQQDYGMRIYDPRLGRFLSIDPLTGKFPFYTPYQYAGNSPIRFIDLDGAETYDNSAKYWNAQPLISMANAPVRGKPNAAGFPRNNVWFFKQQLAAKPEMFSEANKVNIKANINPVVDAQWIKNNPATAEYMGSKLVHHHINGGEFAAAIPEQLHRDAYSELHPYVNKGISPRGAKISGLLGGTLNALGNIGMFSGAFTGNPDSWINAFGIGDPSVGDIKKDWESDLYVQIMAIQPIYEPYKDKDGQSKYRLKSKTITANVYSGFIWNEDNKKYEGVDKIETIHEEWKYNEKGKRITEKANTKMEKQ